jgi:SAM-dependent methyltransferase
MWADGAAYEAYVGRWSRRVAAQFVGWLAVAPGRRWLDVGCGTGALTAQILATADPSEVIGVDASEGFLASARAQVEDRRVTFHQADARSLPVPDHHCDAIVSGLAINFVPEPERALAEFVRVAAGGAMVAAYVWDYAEGMAMMRYFWDAVAQLDPAAAELDEGPRFPLCRPDALRDLWIATSIAEVSVQAIEIPTLFDSFEDYWRPFLGGQGPGPAYTMSLSPEHREALRDLVRSRLPVGADGTVALSARAWAVRGIAGHA